MSKDINTNEEKDQENVTEHTSPEGTHTSASKTPDEDQSASQAARKEESESATASAEDKESVAEETTSSEPVDGVASFEKGTKNKTTLIAVIVLVVVIVGAIALQSLGYLGTAKNTYQNDVHGYSFKYPEGLQLVAEGNIPAELQNQGVSSMAQLNLTPGDALLVETTEEDGGDNIVYTVLELSNRPSYVDFESYVEALFASLDESQNANNITYEVQEQTIGSGITSTEYTFEMEVPVDQSGNTRTGVFYDNVFEVENGKAYSISFGYPKDIEGAERFVEIYRDLLDSFKPGSMEVEDTSDAMESEGVAEDAMESEDDSMTDEEAATSSMTQ